MPDAVEFPRATEEKSHDECERERKAEHAGVRLDTEKEILRRSMYVQELGCHLLCPHNHHCRSSPVPCGTRFRSSTSLDSSRKRSRFRRIRIPSLEGRGR